MLPKRLVRACLLLALVAAPGTSRGWAVTPSLVKDIKPESADGASTPGLFTSLANGVSLFRAAESESGGELWRSDGTAEGTYLLLDACPGPCDGWYSHLASAGSRSFFLITDRETGESDLWVTAGSPADTFRLATGLLPAIERRAVWIPRLRLLFFVAHEGEQEGEQGAELWRSDGTAAGTYRLSDLAGLGPSELTAFQGRLFFLGDDGAQGPAVWVSNGTPAGTRMFVDPVPGRADHRAPVALAMAGSRLFFFAPRPSNAFALWRSDGTRPGTVPLANLGPGAGAPIVHGATGIGSRLYFVATTADRRKELWASDGTVRGTRPLTDLPEQGDVHLPIPAPEGRAAFMAFDPEHGFEPWLTNGTPTGTRALGLCPGTCSSLDPGSLERPFPGQLHGDRLYFRATNGRHGLEMWTSDGTVAGTRLLRDFCPGACSSQPSSTRALGGQVLFTVQSNLAGAGTRLIRTDGTPKGTVRVVTFANAGVSLYDAGAVPGAILFAGPDFELWRSDGTAAGTRLLKDIEGEVPGGSFPTQLTAVGDRVVFEARPSWTVEKGIWESDGTAAGTVPRGSLPSCAFSHLRYILEILPEGDPIIKCPGVLLRGTPGEPVRLTPSDVQLASDETEIFGGAAFFVAGDVETGIELWKTDGTPEGTEPVIDLRPGAIGSSPSGLTAFQGRLWFAASSEEAGQEELWSTDGTAGGTTRLLLPGDARRVRILGAHLGRLWLSAEDDEHGRELWSTDGTTPGTRVLDLVPGAGSLSPWGLTSAGDRVFFSGEIFSGSTEAGLALWVSDGTAAGTHRLGGAPMWPPSVLEYLPPNHAVVGGRLFYRAASSGGVLWQSDGTVAGTLPVPGPDGQPVQGFQDLAAFAGQLFFTRQNRLWQTDGTPGGTVLVPGSFRDPGELTVAGPRLFFRATAPVHGTELWKLQ